MFDAPRTSWLLWLLPAFLALGALGAHAQEEAPPLHERLRTEAATGNERLQKHLEAIQAAGKEGSELLQQLAGGGVVPKL